MCVMSFIWIPRGLEGDRERERQTETGREKRREMVQNISRVKDSPTSRKSQSWETLSKPQCISIV